MDRSTDYPNLASRLDVQPTSVEKVCRMLDLLEAVERHPALMGRLALKGGTALNLFHGEPRRLSVDLDFNLVGAVARAEMIEVRPIIERAIESVGAGLRYATQTSGRAHAGRTWYLNYYNHTGRADRIELDVSYLNRIPLHGLARAAPWSPDGVERPPITICSALELVAGKVRALLDRVAARDVFDTSWSLALIPPNETRLFKRLFVLFSGTLDHPLTHYSLDRLETLTQRDIDTRLVPMLFGHPSLDRDKLIGQCRSAVEPLLNLDEAEREFVVKLNKGVYQPSILIAEWPEHAQRLSEHPALLWKAENARHRSGGRSQP